MISYGKNALRKKQESQHAKDFMALNLRRIKHSWPMPRREREREENFTTISIKVEDQALLQINKKRRRIYRKYNDSGANKCSSSNKRKNEASTNDVEFHHHKKKINEDHT